MKSAYVKSDIYIIVSVESNTRTLINWWSYANLIV